MGRVRNKRAQPILSSYSVCGGGGGGEIISVKQVGGVQKGKSTACTFQSLCGVCVCGGGGGGGLFQ